MKRISSNCTGNSMRWILAVVGLMLGGCSGPDTPSPTEEPTPTPPCEGENCPSPTPESPTPESPTPESPTPESPTPESPTPESPTPEPVDEDEDGYTEDVDCNDADNTIHPEAEEICDDIDQDCDPSTDSFAGLGITYYTDSDSDGFGDPKSFVEDCTQPPRTVTNDDDCDDSEAAVNPKEAEICDGIDNNCDGNTDEGFPTVEQFPDADGDGYGTDSGSTVSCQIFPGFALLSGDCNDGNANIHPGAPEYTGDAIDNNCNGTIDESSLWDVSNWEEGVWGE